MSLSITCRDEAQPVPRDLVLTLTCDNDHGLFPPEPYRVVFTDFMAAASEATADGWKLSNPVLCPACRA